MQSEIVQEDQTAGKLVKRSNDGDRRVPGFDERLAQTWLIGLLAAWPGRGGGRHYRIWRTFIGMADSIGEELVGGGWKVRVSQRDLAFQSGTRSKRGLAKSIEWLIEHGYLSILSLGTSDHHDILTGVGEGHATTYCVVRQRGSVRENEYMKNSKNCSYSPSSSHSVRYSSLYRPPLPDGMTDLGAREPHLLRLLDFVRTGLVADRVTWTPTKLASLLGISKQAAWEAMGRWEEFSCVDPSGCITVEMFERTYAANDVHRQVLDREAVCRKQALDGTWTPRRVRCGRRLSLAVEYVKDVVERAVEAVARPPVEMVTREDLQALRALALGLSG